MRNLFHSKNHKKEESIRLQHELQLEEDRLFQIEQAKRQLLQSRDEEFARRLQQQLQLEEEQSSPAPTSPQPQPLQPQPQPPQQQQQQQTLTDEEFARRLQEQLNAEEGYEEHSRSPPPAPPVQQQVDQTLSDEEYARRLQEQFESEEREQPQQQPVSPQQQQQYAMPVPALPPRDPARSSAPTITTAPRPSIPSKPVAYHQHTSSVESFSHVTRPPSLTPSTSHNTTNWPQTGDSAAAQQQPLLATTTTPSAPSMSAVGIQPYPHPQAPPSPSVHHLPPDVSSPIIPSSSPNLTAPFSSPIPSYPHITAQQQQQQQQSYEVGSSSVPLYPIYNNSSPVSAHQQAYLPQQKPHQEPTPGSPLTVVTALPQSYQTSPYYNHPSPQQYQHHQTLPAQSQQQQQQTTYPLTYVPPHIQTAGSSAHALTPSPGNPVMFVIPQPRMEPDHPRYQGGQQQQQILSYMSMPIHEQHSTPVKERPSSAMYQYPSLAPAPSPMQQQSSYVQQQASPVQQHQSPAQQQQSPAQQQQSSPVQQRQSPDISTKGKTRFRDPTPPPTRFTHQPPKDDVESMACQPSSNYSRHDNNVAADPYGPPPTGSIQQPNDDAAVLSDHDNGKAQDPFADEHKADGYSSEEEEEEREFAEAKGRSLDEEPPAAFLDGKTKSTSTAPVQTPSNPALQQQEQEEFNPTRYFHEEDLIDLNAPEEYDLDDDGSSDDGSVVMPCPKAIPNEPVEVAIQTDAVSPSSSNDQKPDLDLVDHEAKDFALPPVQPTTEEKPRAEVETQKKNEEVKASPRDNRAEIQRRLAEQMKKQGGFTRVDPTFGISMAPPPSRPVDSNKQEHESEDSTNEQERVKIDKISEEMEGYHNTPASAMASTPFLHAPAIHTPLPMHTPSNAHMMYGQHAHSTSLLIPPGTAHLQHQRPASSYGNRYGSYDDSYMTAPIVYPEHVVKAGAPPGMTPQMGPMETTNEVPSGEYGYYPVDSSGPTKENDDTSTKPITASELGKKLPKIPKSDPNHRHITVASVNPGQRVWIRVKPTDSGKDLAQRIHVVATYKSKKILSITSANGRQIPLDDTPVFEDWNEIAKLEDGAPWEVEWGPLDHSLLGGREFLKQIKASFLSKD